MPCHNAPILAIFSDSVMLNHSAKNFYEKNSSTGRIPLNKKRDFMSQAKKGDTVKVHYTGKFADGTVFDSSLKGDPIQFTIGERTVIPGFEKAIIDMNIGEKKTIEIACEDAYGQRREELVINYDKNQIPNDLNPQVGQVLKFQKKQESPTDAPETAAFVVADITDTHLVLDANHPLAGKDLIFELELIEIV